MRQKKHIYIIQSLNEELFLPELENLMHEGTNAQVSILIYDNEPQQDKTAPILELFDKFFEKKKKKASTEAVSDIIEKLKAKTSEDKLAEKPKKQRSSNASWAMFQALAAAIDDLEVLKKNFAKQQQEKRWSYGEEDLQE